MDKIKKIIRGFLWIILGFDYERMLENNNYTLLKYDKYRIKGIKTYSNGAKVWRWTDAPLKIGKYCSIAHNVNFVLDTGFHQASEITSFPFINNLTKKDELLEIRKHIKLKQGITVGNDVWIGLNTVVLPGVVIGNGCTIAANSVVTKDVLDYSIMGGSPAKLIKMKLNPSLIKEMNKMAWWDWPENLVEKRITDFYKLTVPDFIEKYKNQ